MNSVWRRMTFVILGNQLTKIRMKPLHSVVYKLNIKNDLKPVACMPARVTCFSIRNKSKKHKDLDLDDEQEIYDDDDDISLSRDSKVVKFNTTSLRADVVLKSALGVSRNKIEQVFYESKIRVNGKKIMKKSHAVKLGSEIDVIKSISPQNPDHLYVSRVEVLNIVPKEETIAVTVRRFKNLLIDNYEENPYKASSTKIE